MWQCPKCARTFQNTDQPHFCGKITTIAAYIQDQPPAVQPRLTAIYETIRAAAPEATEKIAWQMPTFFQGENLVHFAAHKAHISLYPGGEAPEAFAPRLAGYRTSKGAIQFALDKPVDHALIADIVRWRVSAVTGGQTAPKAPVAVAPSPMPAFIATALYEHELHSRYDVRPPYQRSGYISWITSAKREATRIKRLAQMLDELHAGDAYMTRAYRAK